MNIKNVLIFSSSLLILRKSSQYLNENNKNNSSYSIEEFKLKYDDIKEIFTIYDQLFNNQYKHILHLSTPFNRKIKYIYNLPYYYTEYENYNFNKLSDFFLNIHIFIN